MFETGTVSLPVKSNLKLDDACPLRFPFFTGLAVLLLREMYTMA